MNRKVTRHTRTWRRPTIDVAACARGRFIAIIALLVIAFVATCCSSLRAEERPLFTELEAQSMTSRSLTAHPNFLSITMCLAPEPYRLPLTDLFHLTDGWRLKSFFQNVSIPGAGELDRSILLFRRPMTSHHSNLLWTGLGTGFGQMFPRDTFGRSRTNGVGVQDPNCFYFKLSFRF